MIPFKNPHDSHMCAPSDLNLFLFRWDDACITFYDKKFLGIEDVDYKRPGNDPETTITWGFPRNFKIFHSTGDETPPFTN